MANEKFTKGYWGVQGVEWRNRQVTCVVTDDFDVISPDIGIRNICDAYLIAQSKNMYRMLVKIHDSMAGNGEYGEFYYDVRELLAKARGEL